jgi:hypothetical protein
LLPLKHFKRTLPPALPWPTHCLLPQLKKRRQLPTATLSAAAQAIPATTLAVMGICVLIYAAIRKDFWVALVVPTFFAISALLFFGNFQIRTSTRWLVWSGHYKEEVLAQPAPANGSLKHIEWDGWGWGGQDFSVLPVFDPTNALATAAKNNHYGKVEGIPCEVDYVKRMESHWYIALFDGYVDQSNWDKCN